MRSSELHCHGITLTRAADKKNPCGQDKTWNSPSTPWCLSPSPSFMQSNQCVRVNCTEGITLTRAAQVLLFSLQKGEAFSLTYQAWVCQHQETMSCYFPLGTMLWVLCVLQFMFHMAGGCAIEERIALMRIRSSLVEANSEQVLASWGRSDDCCSWERVRCNNSTRMLDLFLNVSKPYFDGLEINVGSSFIWICARFPQSILMFSLISLDKLSW